MIRYLTVAMLTLILTCAAAMASPPESPTRPLSPDEQQYFRGLMEPSGHQSCCDLSECRMVEYRQNNKLGVYEFMARNGRDEFSFKDGDNHWHAVPANKILRSENPTGKAVACWSHRLGVLCFNLPAMI